MTRYLLSGVGLLQIAVIALLLKVRGDYQRGYAKGRDEGYREGFEVGCDVGRKGVAEADQLRAEQWWAAAERGVIQAREEIWREGE